MTQTIQQIAELLGVASGSEEDVLLAVQNLYAKADQFRQFIQSQLDELGDDNPFGQSTSAMMICKELRKTLEEFDRLTLGMLELHKPVANRPVE